MIGAPPSNEGGPRPLAPLRREQRIRRPGNQDPSGLRGIRPEMMRLVSICLVVFCLCATAALAGQSRAASAAGVPGNVDDVVLPVGFDGPPPPVPPQLIARDAAGHATVRGVRLTAPLRIDGRLDEALYRDVPPISDFVQMEPQ